MDIRYILEDSGVYNTDRDLSRTPFTYVFITDWLESSKMVQRGVLLVKMDIK